MDINIFNKLYSSITEGNKNIKSGLTKVREILSNETKESNEMLKVYQKYVLNNEEITKEELDTANKQFSDLLKSLGLAGVFGPAGVVRGCSKNSAPISQAVLACFASINMAASVPTIYRGKISLLLMALTITSATCDGGVPISAIILRPAKM